MEFYALALGLAVVAGWCAFVFGIRAGRGRERAATNRYLHDSVLPTFEALGFVTASDNELAPVKLAALRREARAQASALRRSLAGAARVDGLGRNLDLVILDYAREGLRVELAAEIDDVLSEPRQTAVREALREVLRNTVKHSGVDRAEIRVSERDGGIAVEAVDRGIGFDVARRPAGFGISECIVARMAEVGGSGTVVSSPGEGTRVTLWVPR